MDEFHKVFNSVIFYFEIGVLMFLLFIGLHTLVQFNDVAAYKPDQVGEIGHGCFVPDVMQHVLVVH